MKKILKQLLFLFSLSFVVSYLATSIFVIIEARFNNKDRHKIVSMAHEESKLKIKKFNEIKSVVYVHKTYYALESFFSGKTIKEVNDSYTISKRTYLLRDFQWIEVKDNICLSIFVFDEEEQLICEIHKNNEYIGDLIYTKKNQNWVCEYYGDKTFKPPDCI